MLHQKRRVSLCALALGLVCVGLIPLGPTFAQIARDPSDDLAGRSFVSPRLFAPVDAESLDQLRSVVGADVQNDWAAFTVGAAGEWRASIDKRTGRLEHLEGAGIPWIPGRGNRLGWADVAGSGARLQRADMALMASLAQDFAPRVAALLGVEPRNLAWSAARSLHPANYLWFVSFDVLRGGVPIEGAHVTFTVNNGNLIMVDAANLPSPAARVPATRLDRDQARQKLGEYLGGFQAGDHFVDRGSYHLLPAQRSNPRFDEGYEFGQGRELAGVWQFTFKRAGQMGTWRGRVDAATGELLDFFDVNEYAAANGGAYQSDKPATEKVLPLPFTNVSSGGYTNSAGLYSYTSGTVSTTLSGQYVKITDSCGAISKASDATGAIALGTSTGTDCTTPGSGGAGNTHAARTQFYNVNRAKEVARGWLPSNTWLSQQLNVNVNLNQTCNAYWDGTALNFFKSGGGCNNTGELPGVSLHEYGHGLDSNDGSGDPPDNGSGETTGDFTAALATHASCIGAGFLSSNCSGYGDACTSCTGVRDIDYAKHSSNAAATVSNFTQTKCPAPSANNPNYVGPCGANAIATGATSKKKEGHCESLVSSQALWDLANRDLTSAGLSLGAAWALTDRLWYLSRSQGSAHFVCNVSGATWTSNGCAAGTLFRTFRAVDDDNGNLNDGTPHGAAIAAAMNRHGIACTTDTAWNTSFAGCTPPASPTLSASAGNNSATLSWNATSAAYDVYRNETGCSAGFIKVANDVTATSFTDNAVANGLTYYYQIVAQPSGNEACASAPSTCVAVTPANSCTPPAAPTGLGATAGAAGSGTINLAWTAVSGATQYNVYRSTTSGGPYTQIATATTTAYANTGLTAGTTYYYVVRAYAGCESANSNQASATAPSAAPDFSLAASPTTVSIAQGSSGTSTISTSALNGFSSAISLTATGAPTGVTVAFSPASIAAPGTGSSTMTITVASTATAGSSTITVTGSGGGVTHTANLGLTVTSVGNVLQNGVPVTNLSGALNTQRSWTMSVPSGATNLKFTISGGTGDADLYVRFGAAPTLSTYDCRPYVTGNSETCSFATPQVGTYYVMLNAYAAYSGVTLTGSYTVSTPDTTPPTTSLTTPANGATVSGTVSVTASASDNVGVTKVEFYVDGALAATDTTSPYSYSWNSAAVANGSHTLSSKAYDAAGNTGSSATVTVTVSNTAGTELVTNGGFETSVSPWVLSGNAYYTNTGSYPHTGAGYIYLGYVNSASGTAYQTITIPSAATSANLTFWLNVVTSETTTATQYDLLYVEVRNTSGTLLATLATYSNLNGGTAGVYSQKGSFSLLAYKGQTVRLQFRGTTDSSLVTTFRIDDVSVK